MLLLTTLGLAKTAYDIIKLTSDDSTEEERQRSCASLIRKATFNTLCPFVGDAVDFLCDGFDNIRDVSDACA